MDIQLIHNEHPARIRVRLNRVEDVPAEVFVGPCGADRCGDHLSGNHVPVPDQTHRPVTGVFELNPFGLMGLHRNRFRIAFQSLHTGHLVRAYGVRIALKRQLRGLQIRLADLFDLSLEELGILFFGVQPLARSIHAFRVCLFTSWVTGTAPESAWKLAEGTQHPLAPTPLRVFPPENTLV